MPSMKPCNCLHDHCHSNCSKVNALFFWSINKI
uniref:Uncharacterized protein n=1 Tax=Rhizophora mucronata TaxID=61149 RepID=A0A2P2NWR6_RHIMU